MNKKQNLEELANLAKQVDKILKEELEISNIKYDLAEARIINVKSVGVQGDERTYVHPAEITLYENEKFVWNLLFMEKLSMRITNEIKGISRVVYTTAIKPKT